MEGWQQDRGQAADAVQVCKQSPVLSNLKGSSCQLSAELTGASVKQEPTATFGLI